MCKACQSPNSSADAFPHPSSIPIKSNGSVIILPYSGHTSSQLPAPLHSLYAQHSLHSHYPSRFPNIRSVSPPLLHSLHLFPAQYDRSLSPSLRPSIPPSNLHSTSLDSGRLQVSDPYSRNVSLPHHTLPPHTSPCLLRHASPPKAGVSPTDDWRNFVQEPPPNLEMPLNVFEMGDIRNIEPVLSGPFDDASGFDFPTLQKKNFNSYFSAYVAERKKR